MIMEMPNPENVDYASMSESDMHKNPIAEEVLQRKALEYLKNQDKAWFEREYTGELDDSGYLIDKKGNAFTKPMQNIGGGNAYVWVMQETKRELLNGPDFIQPWNDKGLK